MQVTNSLSAAEASPSTQLERFFSLDSSNCSKQERQKAAEDLFDIESDSQSEPGELSDDDDVESATQSFIQDTRNGNINCPISQFNDSQLVRRTSSGTLIEAYNPSLPLNLPSSGAYTPPSHRADSAQSKLEQEVREAVTDFKLYLK